MFFSIVTIKDSIEEIIKINKEKHLRTSTVEFLCTTLKKQKKYSIPIVNDISDIDVEEDNDQEVIINSYTNEFVDFIN